MLTCGYRISHPGALNRTFVELDVATNWAMAPSFLYLAFVRILELLGLVRHDNEELAVGGRQRRHLCRRSAGRATRRRRSVTSWRTMTTSVGRSDSTPLLRAVASTPRSEGRLARLRARPTMSPPPARHCVVAAGMLISSRD